MQQTENYKLNLIDTTDLFSPEPLNKNMETLETELARVEDGVAAEIARLDGEAVRCAINTYTGDKTTKRTHTFPFPPQLVIIWGNTSGDGPIIAIRGQTSGRRTTVSSAVYSVTMTWQENSLALSGSNALDLCNDSYKYYVIAFG